MTSTEMLPDISFFIALESRVWQALVDGDARADARLLDEGFVGVYPSGFATKQEHADQLNNGPTVRSFSIHESRLLWLAPDAALLSYRAVFTRCAHAPAEPPQAMYVSSIWKKRDEDWVNVFSQDTVPSEKR